MKFEKLNNKSKSLYLKIKDGEEVYGVFRGDPFEYYQSKDDFRSPVRYDKYADGLRYFFEINFVRIDQKTGGKSACILSKNTRFAKAMQEMIGEYGADYIYKIKRTGTIPAETTYNIFPKAPLNPEQLAEINKMPLIPLDKTPLVPSSKFLELSKGDDLPPFDESEDLKF